MNNLKDTDMECPTKHCGATLVEPARAVPGLLYVPVKCPRCHFTGRRVNLIVIPDDGEGWAELSK
jgi:phage FluMu protein Com